jgi:cysteinyl-tRNA synthetase
MSEDELSLRLYNTLTREKSDFEPIDPMNVRMYVCGPTVYDFAHIGNARPVIVFDVLFRLLRHLFPGKGTAPDGSRVTYVRNITDVDDKINARALRDFGDEIEAGAITLNEAIRRVTEKTADQFHADVKALGCLEPTFEPRATEFVLPRDDGRTDMVTMIQDLIDRGHAYVAEGESGKEVLFDTASMPDYGALSKRRLDEQQAGARVAVEAHKKSPGDFVLWKESSQREPGWNAAFTHDGKTETIHGRPGWHIECSAMSDALLWDAVRDRLSDEGRAHPHEFDIHGGGLDLIFPHHENEIAQSRCAHGSHAMARYWMHNGYLQVEGRKMSKSEGNFVTIHDLLHTEKFGGRRWPGEVLRLAMLMTHYREPIDFSVKRLEEAESCIYRWAKIRMAYSENRLVDLDEALSEPEPAESLLPMLFDDLNTGPMIQTMQTMARVVEEKVFLKNQSEDTYVGLLLLQSVEWLGIDLTGAVAKLSTPALEENSIGEAIDRRLALIREKNWAEADKIRDELLEQGIQLKDSKDPETGERVTTWEVVR